MKIIIIVLSLLLLSCGGRYHVKQEGTVKVEIVYDFLNQLQGICEASFLIEDFETEELYNKAVAECIIKTLSLLDLSYLFDEL
jgi:hypothetical protein